ncbi:MAG: ABC transporter ATP-binding protein [Actinobacteria bacterium]|nr:ABC transporter ATP-binding protein [Actinomycetota bacterium]
MNTDPAASTRPQGDPKGHSGAARDAPRAEEPVIALHGVRKTYGAGENAVDALKGVDFEARADRMTAIVGPSGSGKSTLLNLIGSLDEPTAGRISFAGRDITSMSERERTRFRARNIGFVFQFLNLLPGLTCEQNVMLGGVIVGMAPREARRRAAELLETVGLGDKRRATARKLSGGQMQRVAIARALINDAPLLLADEPTGNLDERNADEITALLRDHASDGRAVVLVTHNNDLAERYADEIKVVRDGLIQDEQSATVQRTKSSADSGPGTPSMRFEIDPAEDPDRMITGIALAIARHAGGVRLRLTEDGRISMEADES